MNSNITVVLHRNDSSTHKYTMSANLMVSRSIVVHDGAMFVFNGLHGGDAHYFETHDTALILDNNDAWIQSVSGKRLDILSLKPENICLDDIAHSLSNICRFNGHTKYNYSVAQHSVLFYRYMKRQGYSLRIRKQALMHDAPEYIIGDITSPLKQIIKPIIKPIEANIWKAIAAKYDINPELNQVVKRGDLSILFNERQSLFTKLIEWGWSVSPLSGVRIIPWSHSRAKKAFLRACAECEIHD